MPTYIEMQKLSDTMTEGTLLRWNKKVGDKVETGDVLAEIETDKATMELEAFDDGIIHELLVPEGAKVPIGARMAVLLSEGEEAPAPGEKSEPKAEEKAPSKAPGAAPTASQKSAPASTPAKPSSSSTAPAATSARVKASPLAKKIAAEKGVDLSRITGTGPGGRIIQRDVANAQPSPSQTSAAAAAAPIPLPPGDHRRIPLSGMRRVVAERLVLSKTTIPHFYLNIEVDVTALSKLRAELNAAADKSAHLKLTVNDFVVKAAVVAATKVPKVNAAFDGDSIVEFDTVNLSIAVALETGLFTPVIRDAQKKSLREISEAVKDLATRARNKKLKPEEYQFGTITISNLGAYGVESFSAIINPPQAIILSVGAIVKKPVVNAEDAIVVSQRMSIGLSGDHRVVDGAIGAQYLAELRNLLENPAVLLI